MRFGASRLLDRLSIVSDFEFESVTVLILILNS